MRARQSTRQASVLSTLSDGKWHSNTELVKGGSGYRYGAVILELRKKGHDIETKCVEHPAHWEYRLKAEPGDTAS